MSVLNFTMSSFMAEALDLQTMAKSAADAVGIPYQALMFSAMTTDDDHLRITCQPRMAHFLLERLRALSRRAQVQGEARLLRECACRTAPVSPTAELTAENHAPTSQIFRWDAAM